MSWKVRHEGSPRTVDNLTPGQIAQGLEEGLWEPTDEVQGPSDSSWIPIESHPVFAEVAEDLDLTPETKSDEGTHLDMTALIDVCLVLLVFFILTTGYASLQKMLELGSLSFDKDNKVKRVKREELNELALNISVRMEDGKPVMRLENEVVTPQQLPDRLTSLVRQTRKVTVAVTHDNDVPWGSVLPIQDAAKLAGIQDAVLWVIPDEFLTQAPKSAP
jgi:biopolymer transport protein ExbD